uniref:Transducer of regulated CREB activity C-terminal domain-containing protein n=1 Tax=Cynoglossus semilaevis TaxID=244447 RepID=A0A3P8WA62_CYNSE
VCAHSGRSADELCPLSSGFLASLQSTLSNSSLQSSLSNPNIQSSLSSHSFSNSLSSASLHSLSNPSLQSSLSSSPSLPSSLSSSSSSSYQPLLSGQGQPGTLSTSPRRRAQLSPLILPMGGETRRHHSKQFSPTISPTLSSITQGVPLDTSKLPLDQRLPPYPLSQSHQHQHPPGSHQPVSNLSGSQQSQQPPGMVSHPHHHQQLHRLQQTRPNNQPIRSAFFLASSVQSRSPPFVIAGDSPPGLSKEIASALSHVPGFEMDPFSLDDPLRMDHLALDMLEGDLMLADPAVEDSFRSDRLK